MRDKDKARKLREISTTTKKTCRCGPCCRCDVLIGLNESGIGDRWRREERDWLKRYAEHTIICWSNAQGEPALLL